MESTKQDYYREGFKLGMQLIKERIKLAAELKNVMLDEQIQNVMTVYDKVSVEYDFMEKMEQ